jgi:ABC-2 type transport system ATP-binding protein
MVVRDYLSFVGKARGMHGAKLKERIDWGIQAMKLEQVTHKRCMECSKGFKQRIALAATLLHDPKIILLDEPTVGLDPLQVFQLRDFLKLLTPDKILLFSSHILQEVAAMTQRVLIIHEGHHIADISFTAQDNRTERLENIFRDAVASGKRWYEEPAGEVAQ